MSTLGLLISLVACGPSKDGAAAPASNDTSDIGGIDSDVVDSGEGDPSDTGSDDTSDTGQTGNRSPYADCTAQVSDTSGFVGTWTYDADGHVVTYRYDDGRLPMGFTYSRDAAGNLLSYTRDNYDDGSVDERGFYTYDAYDRLVVSTVEDAAGVVVITVSYLYDAAGNRVSTTYLSAGSNYLNEVTYDGRGNPLVNTYDYGMDGSVDSRTEYRYTYDAAGQIVLQEVDNDRDGMFEVQVVMAYDAAGRRVSMESVTTYGGSTIVAYFAWVYDASGRLVTQSYDDGRSADYATFRHDALGRVVEETHDYAPVGSIDLVTTTTYTCP